MKLSISIPNQTAREIRAIALKTDRSISWLFQRAWDLARMRIFYDSAEVEQKRKRALKKLFSLEGTLKSTHPHTDSVTLAHQAFKK